MVTERAQTFPLARVKFPRLAVDTPMFSELVFISRWSTIVSGCPTVTALMETLLVKSSKVKVAFWVLPGLDSVQADPVTHVNAKAGTGSKSVSVIRPHRNLVQARRLE